MRNKKIQILLVFVLAIGLFGLLFYWRYGEKKQMESLNGLQETYKEYDKKIREIRNDMENKKAEVNDIEKPANVILAFSEEDQELMDRIVPALEGRGHSCFEKHSGASSGNSDVFRTARLGFRFWR